MCDFCSPLSSTSCVFRPSRTRSFSSHLAARVAMEIFCVQADLSREEGVWTSTSFLELSPVNGKYRSRRVSTAYKEAVAQVVYDKPHMGSARNFLAVSKEVGGQKGGEAMKYSDTNSPAITRETMFNYWVGCREAHADIKALHLGIDGVRCGGDETNAFVAYSPELGKAAFPPPQAISQRRNRSISSR